MEDKQKILGQRERVKRLWNHYTVEWTHEIRTRVRNTPLQDM